MPVFLLSNTIAFPPPHLADKSGLLAVGGDLSRERLIKAYRSGIFPWYSGGEPILWWSPDPRLVLFPHALHVSKRLERILRKGEFQISFDRAFPEVIRACAESRAQKNEGTWLVPEMIEAYETLHEFGQAHSVEAWRNGQLVGGLYGVSLGRCFFGESMFTKVANASKAAFVTLVRQLTALNFDMIDCQVTTAHLVNFGATEISRKKFLILLDASLKKPTIPGRWSGL
ncbi:MAG: leucyl/phenylalanyl-tRNA--protein transferase [Desulfobacterales bacterium]|jgi:leucyl/phenylalanyl-tRNA--protein transferase|nr:leucyl/phenylalanyl-tRNA--protein transferase [Desulfobacterales bacterium]